MSHSIRKAAAAALMLGCGLAVLFLPAVAGEPPKPPAVVGSGGVLPPEFGPGNFDPDEIEVPAPPLEPPPLRPASEKERQIFKQIRASWQARHERIHSLHISWESPGGRTGPNAVPPDSHTEVWIDADDFRMRELTSYRGRATAILYLTTFDGMTTRAWDSGKHAGDVWNGQSERRLAHGVASIWQLAIDPLRCDLIDISSADVGVRCEDAMLGDQHCVKLRFPVKVRDSDYKMRDTLWVDPARDNLIIRWERILQERATASLSIDYKRDKQHGWLPTQWLETFPWSSGDSATVIRIAINEQYPVSTFRLTFPPGTEVYDRKLSQHYLIAADGSKTQVVQFYPVEWETIYDSLNRRTDFVIDPEPLKDALEFIAQRYHIKTVFDDRGVRQGLIDPAVEVAANKHGMKLKELLELLLKQSPKPLRYEIRDDVVTVIACPK
jgi:hypothetical protein